MINSSVIITSYKDKIISFLDQNNKIQKLSIETNASLIGNIYLARVSHVVKNLNACFVSINKDTLAFLSFNDVLDGLRIIEGMDLLVQIVKDSAKGKEAVVTMKLSLQGKYSIVELSKQCINVSKKITGEKRAYFKESLNDISEYGVIIRTNANYIDDISIIEQEVKDLSSKLSAIIADSKTRTCYSLMHQHQTDFEVFINGLPDNSYDRILTDLPSVKEKLPNVIFYEDDYPLLKLYSVETKIDELLSKQIWLKNGGNIVIEYTEAMTVIDVNTAKNMSNKSKEEAILETNIEAAKEILRQVRLRNLSGIIIIDFINLNTDISKQNLVDVIKQECLRDSVRCEFVEITKLGLVELVRKKTKAPIYEIL